MFADISERSSTEKCVGESVECHIGITVSEKTAVVRDVHTADNASATFDEPVHVESVADPEIGYIHICYRLEPKMSRRPSISKVRLKRRVWSSGELAAVASMYEASRRTTLSENPAPREK